MGRISFKAALSAVVFGAIVSSSHAGQLWSYPHDGTGTMSPSSWVTPDGSDSDTYSYDVFKLDAPTTLTDIKWRGGSSANSGLTGFTVMFYNSLGQGYQPLCHNPQIDESDIAIKIYNIHGMPSETQVGSFGGVPMSDFSYHFPTTLNLAPGYYWVKIEAATTQFPSWGVARGTGGNNSHFRFITGLAMFQYVSNDLCFTLYGSQSQTLAPKTATMKLGRNTSGDVASLTAVDANEFVGCKGFVPNFSSPYFQVQLDSQSGVVGFTSYSMTAVARSLHGGSWELKVEPYNFAQALFDSAVTAPMGLSNTSLTATPSQPADYRGPAGEVRGRVSTRQVGFSAVAVPCTAVDAVSWSVAQN